MPQHFAGRKRVVGRAASRHNAAMSDVRQGPTTTPQAREQAEERRRRQAEALRANLARRKAQARVRAGEEEAGGGTPPEGKTGS